jgi:hypothetical protein
MCRLKARESNETVCVHHVCTMYPPPKPVFMNQRIWHKSLSFVLSQVHDL